MRNGTEIASLVMLAGEQAAPNLLPARHFKPQDVLILHSGFARSVTMAGNLKMLLADMRPRLAQIDDFDVGRISGQVQALIGGLQSVAVNITGGTKPMSLGALEAARRSGAQVFYVRSQGAKTEIDFYEFNSNGSPGIRETISLQGTINLKDYLVSYFGDRWSVAGFGGTEEGIAFEKAIHAVLVKGTDEVLSGWRDGSNQVEEDFVIRCSNQIGIVQAKTGKSALSMEGIKQLMTGGDQRFFGTYAKRILIVDRLWGKNEKRLWELCETLKIRLVELPGFSETQKIDPEDEDKLLSAIIAEMGMPSKGLSK